MLTDSWEKHFDKISIEERSKFDEETLYNVQGVKMNRRYFKKPDSCTKENELLVLTILLAAEGKLEFPIVRSAADLTKVLGILNSIHANEIQGIQVLWTPQEEGDVLSEERLLKDYPHLKPLMKNLSAGSCAIPIASTTEGKDSS
uniref:Uncharacterized protein n=1 Tax=Leersia perrieri TaxID=77586 RepID=A0A0D9X3X4_9ORYZ